MMDPYIKYVMDPYIRYVKTFVMFNLVTFFFFAYLGVVLGDSWISPEDFVVSTRIVVVKC